MIKHAARLLNDRQLAWLRRWFPVTENCRLAKVMRISEQKLRDFAVENGLKKTAAGLRAIKRRQTKAMVKTNNQGGCTTIAKRGTPVSEATRAGNRKRWEEYRARTSRIDV